jgi:hypothetical protein
MDVKGKYEHYCKSRKIHWDNWNAPLCIHSAFYCHEMQYFGTSDVEGRELSDRNHGFASAARFIAQDHDNETFVFKRFDELAARNLLYLQAELLSLESRLRAFDEQVKRSEDPDVKDAARSWEVFTMEINGKNEEAIGKMKLIMAIREKVKEYRSLFPPVNQPRVSHCKT